MPSLNFSDFLPSLTPPLPLKGREGGGLGKVVIQRITTQTFKFQVASLPVGGPGTILYRYDTKVNVCEYRKKPGSLPETGGRNPPLLLRSERREGCSSCPRRLPLYFFINPPPPNYFRLISPERLSEIIRRVGGEKIEGRGLSRGELISPPLREPYTRG